MLKRAVHFTSALAKNSSSSAFRIDPNDPKTILSPAEDFPVPKMDSFDYMYKDSEKRWGNRIALVSKLSKALNFMLAFRRMH